MNAAMKVSNIKLCTTSHNNLVCVIVIHVDEARSSQDISVVFPVLLGGKQKARDCSVFS